MTVATGFKLREEAIMASCSGQREAALAALLLAATVGLNAAVVLVLAGITILHWREVTTG